MGAYCTINPKVRSPKTGELVESKLFYDLKKSIGYNNARSVYIKVRDNDFIDEYGDILDTDENGEFTFESLKKIPELKSRIGIKARKTKTAKDVGAYSPEFASPENIATAEDKTISYNSIPGNEFVALPEIYKDNDGNDIVNIRLVENTPENRNEASKVSKARVLRSRLFNYLERIGVNNDVVDGLLYGLRADGYSDYDALISIADSLRSAISRAYGNNDTVMLNDEIANIVYSALRDNPIIDRLISVIISNNLSNEIFSDDELSELNRIFNGQDYFISEAAVVRLISSYILNNNVSDLMSDEDLSVLSSLMRRLDDAYVDFFSSMDTSVIDSYIQEAQGRMSDYNGETVVEFNQVTDTEQYDWVKKNVEKQRDLLHDLIETGVKRYKILSSRNIDFDSEFESGLAATLSTRFIDEEYELGIYDFIDATLDKLLDIEDRLRELSKNTNMSLERRGSELKDIKDFIQSFKVSIDAIVNAEYSGVISPNKERDEAIHQTAAMIGNITAQYERQKEPLLVDFVRRFVGDGLAVPFGEKAGKKVYTAEDILEMADKDITVFDRWLDSMAESGDLMLRMLDAKAKEARNSARLETIEYKRKIDGVYNKLVKSGIRDTSFMFKMDKHGNKTGEYISDEEADNLDLARRNYYYSIMEIKKELDAKLPKGATSLHNIVRVRKDYLERLKSQSSIKGIMHETKEALRDKVKRRSDNAEAGSSEDINNDEMEKSILLDFNGKQVETLPIMFVNSKDGENLNDISDDVTSAMLMYANMASNFSAMNNIVGLLEIVRDKVSERPVQQRAGNKALVNVLKAFGLTVSTEYTKSGEATNIVKRMNDWFSSQVYSRYMKDEGEIFGMDIGMLANLSNEVTALNQFALNILSGISNVMTASAMNRIESICGQYFSVKDLANADGIFWKALPEFLGDVGNPVKSSKLALFMEKFNVMQDFESDVRSQEYGKSRLARLLNTNSLYVINNAGELWIQNRAALALGMNYGLVDAKGNKISLWDSQKVVTDKNGVSRLVTIDGVRKADGTAFDEKEEFKFIKKAKSLNQRMNGIYNYEDRCAAQAYSWGRMALMFRKWIKPSLNRRYGSLNYNFDVEEWEEGFYRTTGRFFMQLVNDLKRGQLDIVTSYKNLDPREKANIMRFAVEVGQFISVCAAFAILKDIKKKADDDDDALAKSWWFNQLLYQTRRLETEIGSQMIINPQMTQEAFNILKSPASCVTTWEGVTNLTKLMMPSSYTTTLQSGRYKGHTKAYKLFWDSPLIPMHRTVYRGLHPQNSLQFYDL